MSQIMIRRVRLFAILVTMSSISGVAFETLYPWPHPVENFHYLFNWTVGPAMVWGIQVFYLPSKWGAPIRRMYFLTALLLKAVILMGVVIFVGTAHQVLLHGNFALDFFLQPELLTLTLYVFLSVALLLTTAQVVRITGGRVLLKFILGKYHQPVREQRIFMFLDLVGSTPLAERLGDIGVQTLLTRFFFDITEPILEFGGEIHRYVGDQVIIIWPYTGAKNVIAAVRCYFAIAEKIRLLAPEYERDFDAVPEFKAGLHGGPVVISECGDFKQEIVYFGDTINTAARIEQQCKSLESRFLVSGELLAATELPDPYQAVSKGVVQLRGRAHETELFEIQLDQVTSSS